MSKPEIIIYGFAFIGITAAMVALIKTPVEQWFKPPEHEKEEGVDYAPEYTKKERAVFVLKHLTWIILLFAIGKFWFFNWLAEYAKNANCYNYGNINGLHLIFYGLFVFMPISIAVIIFLMEGEHSIKVIRLRQYPLPDEKVFRPTKYRHGVAALIQPIVIFSVILYLIGLSIWGGFQAHELTRDIKPCTVNKSFNRSDATNAHHSWLNL